jgi:hypothetical protein
VAVALDAIPERHLQVTTIGLPLAIWGEGYAQFLSRWWDGVGSLQRQPDEVAIVTDAQNLPEVLEHIGHVKTRIILDRTSTTYAQFWNKAVNALESDWLGFCNADDKFLPEALNDVEQAEKEGCNLITDVIQDLDGGQLHKSRWNGEEVGKAWTLVGAEPMKRDLFIKAGGFPEGQRFADWALAMKMNLAGVKAYDTDTIRILYDRGLKRKTVSSILNGQDVLQKGYKAVNELSKELGYK